MRGHGPFRPFFAAEPVRLEKGVLHSEESCPGAGGQANLVVDVLNVVLDRVRGKLETLGHVAVGEAAC